MLCSVIAKERQGKYLGKTVQVVPHIVNEIQKWIERVASMPVSICILLFAFEMFIVDGFHLFFGLCCCSLILKWFILMF